MPGIYSIDPRKSEIVVTRWDIPAMQSRLGVLREDLDSLVRSGLEEEAVGVREEIAQVEAEIGGAPARLTDDEVTTLRCHQDLVMMGMWASRDGFSFEFTQSDGLLKPVDAWVKMVNSTPDLSFNGVVHIDCVETENTHRIVIDNNEVFLQTVDYVVWKNDPDFDFPQAH